MYYSPILFSQIADLNLTQYHKCDINMEHLNSKDRIIVFCLHSMGHLNKLNPFLANVKKPFILISAMEDTELPREIDPDLMAKIKENLHNQYIKFMLTKFLYIYYKN